MQVLIAHVTGGMLTHSLEHVLDGDILPLVTTRQDGATIEEDARHIEAHHDHHHARQRLVATGKADHGIIAMATHGELNGISDHFTGHQ